MTEKAITDRMALALRLRQARDAAGLSQGQAARLLDMHRPTITEVELGNRKVSTDELLAFAKLYDVDSQWLLGLSPSSLEADDPRLQLAAREMKQLKPKDLEKLLELLATMRGSR
jgi:transcriptional regulator with XRE-family HTH domain